MKIKINMNSLQNLTKSEMASVVGNGFNQTKASYVFSHALYFCSKGKLWYHPNTTKVQIGVCPTTPYPKAYYPDERSLPIKNSSRQGRRWNTCNQRPEGNGRGWE